MNPEACASGRDGVLAVAAVTSTSVSLRWNPAGSDGATGLNYRVFYSRESKRRTPDEMQAKGTPIGVGARRLHDGGACVCRVKGIAGPTT
ncbi:MAG: fibronectin type III domain-containing protein [Leptospirales bacterium]